MALRSVHGEFETTREWRAAVVPSVRSHRSLHSRRAHRAAHAAVGFPTRRWSALGALSLLVPFAVAATILELVR